VCSRQLMCPWIHVRFLNMVFSGLFVCLCRQWDKNASNESLPWATFIFNTIHLNSRQSNRFVVSWKWILYCKQSLWSALDVRNHPGPCTSLQIEFTTCFALIDSPTLNQNWFCIFVGLMSFSTFVIHESAKLYNDCKAALLFETWKLRQKVG
jgi:hypothetical protein